MSQISSRLNLHRLLCAIGYHYCRFHASIETDDGKGKWRAMKDCGVCYAAWIKQDDGSWKRWRGVAHERCDGTVLAIPYERVSKTVHRLLFPTAEK